MFIVTTALAVVCSGLFAGPAWVSFVTLVVLGLLTTIVFAVAVVYGRGYLRTFAIGALFPSAPLLLCWLYFAATILIELWGDPAGVARAFSPGGTADDSVPRLGVVILVGAATFVILLCGLFAMLVRWLVERVQRPEPEAAEPAAEPEP